MYQFSREEAIAIADSKAYEKMPVHHRAWFQLNQKKLCMPWSVFHESVQEALKRPVLTHEFVDLTHLKLKMKDMYPGIEYTNQVEMVS